MKNEQQKEFEKQLKKLKSKLNLLEQLATTKGFINLYFKKLQTAKSQKQAFHYLNDLYYEFTGEYRYSNYNSFRNVKNNYLKTKY